MRAPRVLRHLQGSSKQHGDAKLTVLLQTLADCPEARSPSIYARCKAVTAIARNKDSIAGLFVWRVQPNPGAAVSARVDSLQLRGAIHKTKMRDRAAFI